MDESVRKVDLYSVEIPNKPGEGARVLGALRDAGVNFTAVWGYPLRGRLARIDMVPGDRALFTKAAKKAGLTLSPRQTAFAIEGDDHPGTLADPLAKLAAAGINVYAAQAVCSGGNRYGGVIMVGADDARKAGKLLGAS
jgi:hypothetical protein